MPLALVALCGASILTLTLFKVKEISLLGDNQETMHHYFRFYYEGLIIGLGLAAILVIIHLFLEVFEF